MLHVDNQEILECGLNNNKSLIWNSIAAAASATPRWMRRIINYAMINYDFCCLSKQDMMILATCVYNSAIALLNCHFMISYRICYPAFFYWHIFSFIAMAISEIWFALSKFAARLQIRPMFTCSADRILGIPRHGSLCHLQHFLILQWQNQVILVPYCKLEQCVYLWSLWAETKIISINYSATYKKWWVFNQYKSNSYKIHFKYN